MWRLVVLLSLGGCFEFYDLFLTAYLSPALESAGIFRKGAAEHAVVCVSIGVFGPRTRDRALEEIA